MNKRVLLAAPRGYCAGVDRAVVAVEQALEVYGAPIYVRKQIVHNKHVVSTLERKGAIFYGIMRALQLRQLRLPPPTVKIGGASKEFK